MDRIEKITSKGKVLVLIISRNYPCDKTSFFTPHEANMQVGYVVYPGKSKIQPHLHKKILRKLDRTEEVLVVRKGKCRLDVYDEDKEFVASKNLQEGDIVILVAGGHGFQMLEDTVLLEIKQGPYSGVIEKERF